MGEEGGADAVCVEFSEVFGFVGDSADGGALWVFDFDGDGFAVVACAKDESALAAGEVADPCHAVALECLAHSVFADALHDEFFEEVLLGGDGARVHHGARDGVGDGGGFAVRTVHEEDVPVGGEVVAGFIEEALDDFVAVLAAFECDDGAFPFLGEVGWVEDDRVEGSFDGGKEVGFFARDFFVLECFAGGDGARVDVNGEDARDACRVCGGFGLDAAARAHVEDAAVRVALDAVGEEEAVVMRFVEFPVVHVGLSMVERFNGFQNA